MKRRLAALASIAIVTLLALAPATQAQPKPMPACVKTSSEVRARAVGYDHLVAIENTCEKPAACTVSTDVAPEPLQVTVEPKKTVELTTFRGSPAREFKPTVSCKLL
jgi:hypothetical protein